LTLSSPELFDHTSSLPTETRIVSDVLATETDPLFRWQYDRSGKCPAGCRHARANGAGDGRTCIPGDESEEDLAGEVAEEVVRGTAKGVVGFWSVIFKFFKIAAPVGDEL
jgi:hypothetical protein